MSTELAVALVAGLFSLIPLMVQIATTRAQHRDRMTRLTQLRTELELLERLRTLQGEISVTDESANPQTDLVIRNSLSKVLAQYNSLSEITPSGVVGGKPPPPQQLSFLRRAFLLYNPHTTSGWVLHTLFYFFALFFIAWLPHSPSDFKPTLLVGWAITAIPLGIVLLVLRRLARRNATRNAAQLEEPNA